MSTNSTELTFVRCPSCRSLVPAVSVRCRMCGATLEGVGATATSAEATKPSSSRVRQKTITQPTDEINRALQSLRSEPVELSAVEEHPASTDHSDTTSPDPLQAYWEEPLEEVEIELPSGDSNTDLLSSLRAVEVPEEVEQEPLPIVKEPINLPIKNNTVKEEQNMAVNKIVATLPKTSVSKGRLCGWLVSFENNDGQAIELREGKYFITSQAVKENDLVIDHPSISAPHCIIRVSTQAGLQLQDMMSETGLAVKVSGSSDFVSQEERISVKHGDRIKIGEVEFLVALLPE